MFRSDVDLGAMLIYETMSVHNTYVAALICAAASWSSSSEMQVRS